MIVNLYSAINGLDRFELNHTLDSSIVSEGKSTSTLTTAKVADYVIGALAVLAIIGGFIALVSIGANAPGVLNMASIPFAGLCTLLLQEQYSINLVGKIKTRLIRNCILNLSSPRTTSVNNNGDSESEAV